MVEFSSEKYSQFLCSPSGTKTISMGIGEREKINNRKFILLARKIIVFAKSHKIKKISLNYADFQFPKTGFSEKEMAEVFATNLEMANYEFIKYRSKPKEGWNFIDEVAIHGKVPANIKTAFKRGKIIGEQVNGSREISNIPGTDMTPNLMVSHAKKLFQKTKVKVSVFDHKKLKSMKMEAILAVGKGSSEKPKMIILEYNGSPNKKEKPVVLVGKGVTFDTGGINLKPADGLKDMQMDMSGGAAVMHVLALAEKLKVKKNIVALIPAVENMPSGSSLRPGDIIKTMSGKTVEVRNTDAEGRIILSDALTYAKKYNPKVVIDVATLTGAAMVAIGYRASAIFSSNEKFHQIFKNLGEKSGDYVWPFPLWEEYESEIKGNAGDIDNIGKYERWGGHLTAAAFLFQFAKEYPWIHIDIAPKTTAADDEHLTKGSAGAPIRLLIKFLEEYK